MLLLIMADTEEPVDTYVRWIDRITPDERTAYLDRLKYLQKTYPLIDSMTLGVMAKYTDEELGEIFSTCDPDWKPEPPQQTEEQEKCVMCFNSREEMEEYNKKHK